MLRDYREGEGFGYARGGGNLTLGEVSDQRERRKLLDVKGERSGDLITGALFCEYDRVRVVLQNTCRVTLLALL